jgi:hypothetical protein
MQEPFIQRAVSILNKHDSVEAIRKIAREKVGSEISIGFPKLSKEKNKVIYFLVNTPNSDTIDLKTTIKNFLEFDYENDDDNEDVIILNEQLHSSQTISTFVEDVTHLIPENFNKIQSLLKTHHPGLQKDADVIAHQDKRRRSVSPPRSSLFTQSGSQQKAEFDESLSEADKAALKVQLTELVSTFMREHNCTETALINDLPVIAKEVRPVLPLPPLRATES